MKRLLETRLQQSIVVLDGAMGTQLQMMKGEIEDKVRQVHKAYLEAGADIISTHTFIANEGLADDIVAENKKYATIAREEADAFLNREVYVAGSIGPTSYTLSLSDTINFDFIYANYFAQIKGLAAGGVDVLLFETVFDTLNLKAGLKAAKDAAPHLPLMISATIEKNGRLLSGQTLEAFWQTIKPYSPLSVGLNCSFGAKEMRPFLEEFSQIASTYISVYPNAGFPNELGEYEQLPEQMAKELLPLLEASCVNIVGGCCGTIAEHIRLIAEMTKNYTPHELNKIETKSYLSGLETLCVDKFTHVGERCNVAGSRKFARLIAEEQYDEALQIARKQVDSGAQVIDVCMDDGMLDAPACMDKFLHLINLDPFISKVPIMVDSSRWEALEAGLKQIQGKAIVNSISLKEGEEVFLEKANIIQSYGAAVVVMAFDENGQADTYEKRTQICARSYHLLRDKIDFAPEDIYFDPNVLSIATGIPEHDNYGIDFINTIKFIKENLPYANVTGGVSNLSFSFRGNNKVREAMHSVFLYHAIKVGLDMAIVNPALLEVYDQIEPQLLARVEAVVLNTHAKATEELIEYAKSIQQDKNIQSLKKDEWRSISVEERIAYALINGTNEYLIDDVKEALNTHEPIDIIEHVLMKGITTVGKYFGEGKMFLPQVVKSASLMKQAVAFLEPLIEQGQESRIDRPKILLATVKGDVHDIGKNIVGIVLSCNGYDVVDLGVMVPKQKIMKAIDQHSPIAVCLSGLIAPSLLEMQEVAKEMELKQCTVPLVLGGAATSPMHTACKIDPMYSGLVVQSPDASDSLRVVVQLLSDRVGEYTQEIKDIYTKLREKQADKKPIKRAKVQINWEEEKINVPKEKGIKSFVDYSITEISSYINWKAFTSVWKVKGETAEQLIEDAKQFFANNRSVFKASAVVGIFPTEIVGDEVRLASIPFVFPRIDQLSLSDFISPKGDYLGAFAATVNAEEKIKEFKQAGDDYHALMTQLLADRLVEAFSELLHEKMRTRWWGFNKGIRPAIGYAGAPNHDMKRDLFDLLDVENTIDIKLTENYAMLPLSSVSGFYFAHDKAKYF